MSSRGFCGLGAAVVLVLGLAVPAAEAIYSKKLALVNANIYTVDEAKPTAKAVRMENGKFSEVGETVRVDDGVTVVDVQGLTVVPGFVDSHVHLLGLGAFSPRQLMTTAFLTPEDGAGLARQAVNLVGAASTEEIRRRIKEYLKENRRKVGKRKAKDWVYGLGWNQNLWGDGTFPTAADLDSDPELAAVPIALLRIDVHAAWVNGQVLKKLGELPAEVPGGAIVRNDKGEATGIFIDNAMDILLLSAPIPPEHKLAAVVREAINECNSLGITSVHEAGLSQTVIDMYKRLIDSYSFSIRNYVMATCDERNTFCNIPKIDDYGGRLTVRSVKLFLDGALGSWGAAMLANYTDNPSTAGFLRMDPELLPDLVRQWIDAGFQVNAHAIGDRANRVAIDAFEEAINAVGRDKDLRLRLEHAQHLTLPDIERIGKLGILCSMQPTHATSDKAYAEQRVGPERIAGSYAWRRLLDAGAVALPLGSDFPVEQVNPMLTFHAAITRQDEHNLPEGGWYADQALTRAEALKGMTLDGAYAAFQEKIIGSITVGKRADFIILDHDIMTMPVCDILRTRVLATVIDGHCVYNSQHPTVSRLCEYDYIPDHDEF